MCPKSASRRPWSSAVWSGFTLFSKCICPSTYGHYRICIHDQARISVSQMSRMTPKWCTCHIDWWRHWKYHMYRQECQNWARAWQNQQNDLRAQRRLRSAWASIQSDQSSLRAQWAVKEPWFLHADIKGRSYWDNAQNDLSLRWLHRLFCWFRHAAAQIFNLPGVIWITYPCENKTLFCLKAAFPQFFFCVYFRKLQKCCGCF